MEKLRLKATKLKVWMTLKLSEFGALEQRIDWKGLWSLVPHCTGRASHGPETSAGRRRYQERSRRASSLCWPRAISRASMLISYPRAWRLMILSNMALLQRNRSQSRFTFFFVKHLEAQSVSPAPVDPPSARRECLCFM